MMAGTVIEVLVKTGDQVTDGMEIAILESMKMQMPVVAFSAGTIRAIHATIGDVLAEDAVVATIDITGATHQESEESIIDLTEIRPDLGALQARLQALTDEARLEATTRRHATGKRMIRENIGDLCDPESFSEYGALALAAQRRRRTMEELIRLSPADGLIAGIGTVHSRPTAVLGYDYTVMAGTQGFMNHKKTDRLLRVVHEQRLPLVLFAEGGGGRPGDTDVMGVAGLDLTSFASFARLSGKAPLLGIASGFCFAGNAAFLGCCDSIIATKDSSMGMGGPAMIEGGGLGVVAAEDVGPVSVQFPNGVIDIVADDETHAVAIAKNYLAYFNGKSDHHTHQDQRHLRQAVPPDRKRIYDMRALIHILADTDSVLELRRAFAPGMITSLIRIEGSPFGLIANNPAHLGGAIDADGADKAARFLQLCEAHALPVISLCDTPGFMVGPHIETKAQIRHVSRLFVGAAKLTVPVFCIVTRKGYGLGAMAMAAGGFHEPVFSIAWPTGEFGGMGLEGAVRLGYRRELAAIENPVERQAMFDKMVEKLYEEGQAMNMAAYVEIDAVIDPAETRGWITRGLTITVNRPHQGVRFIDTW